MNTQAGRPAQRWDGFYACHKPQILTPTDFAYLLQVMNRLVEQGVITMRHKEETARRIAEEYELSPLYI